MYVDPDSVMDVVSEVPVSKYTMVSSSTISPSDLVSVTTSMEVHVKVEDLDVSYNSSMLITESDDEGYQDDALTESRFRDITLQEFNK